jgi:hypothetical protein
MMEATSDGLYELIAVARPFGPPLTVSEQALRLALAVAFVGMLAIESWLLWNAWTLWA